MVKSYEVITNGFLLDQLTVCESDTKESPTKWMIL
jgi:hypothetical protein